MAVYKFDPVKEDQSGVIARRQIWSTQSLDLAFEGLKQGKKLCANPFYENNTKLLKANLNFQRTAEEEEEFIKCMQDILYFANKYCKLMTPEGIKTIHLRDYQENYLKHLQDNRLSIYLACRQCGKCLMIDTQIVIKVTKKFLNTLDCKVKKYWDDNFYNIKDDTYTIPLFELQNLYDKSFVWKIKYRLYKILYKIWQKEEEKIIGEMYKSLKRGILLIISLLDKTEKSNYILDETGKLVKSFPLEGIKVWTDTGWQDAGFLHQTRPFYIWRVATKNHYLECADLHKLFRPDFSEVFVDELKIGDEILTDNGPETVIDIQVSNICVCMNDLTIMDGNSRFYSNGILSHNTTTSAIFMLWYILFNVDKNSLVLGNKRKTAVEILDKIKKIYLEIPYFLKPGIMKWNEGEIVLDNGCRCMCEATTINSGISFTFHCVLADEFAHLPKNIMEPFYNNLFPTITAGKARFMITSTQNGFNLFYRLYTAAVAGENDYAPFVTDWCEVPEWDPDNLCWCKRDEEWHKRQVANYGGEEEFNKQFGTGFCSTTATLINSRFVKDKMKESYSFKNIDMLGCMYSENWFWKDNFEMAELKNHYYLITGDLAEGIGSDYTVFTVWQVNIVNGEFYYECVGYFRNNKLSLECCHKAISEMCMLYMNTEQYLISIEWNTYGAIFESLVKEFDEKNNNIVYNRSSYISYEGTRKDEYIMGYKLNSANKSICCNNFKRLYESNHIIYNDNKFLNELQSFGDISGTGKYAAISGHDDMIMSAVGLTYALDSNLWKNIKDTIYATQGKPQANNVVFYDIYSF